MAFKENLKVMRASAGFHTAREFAKALGIPYSRYINYEGSKASEAPYSELIKIAKGLHVSIDELLNNKVNNDNILIQFIHKALEETEFELLDINEKTATIRLKSSDRIVSVSREMFMKNAEEEFNNAQQAMCEILGSRLSVSLRLACMNTIDISDPDTRKSILAANIYNTRLENLTVPTMITSKKN